MVPLSNAAVSDTVVNHVCSKDCGLEFCTVGVLGAVKTGLKRVNTDGLGRHPATGTLVLSSVVLLSKVAFTYSRSWSRNMKWKILEIIPKF